jgi:S1-C subfamily serine protease
VKSSPALAGRFGFPSGSEGVVAVSVEPGGLAAAAGLVEGDLVASVNGIETPDPKTFLAAAKSADARQGLVFDVCRRGRWIYLTFKAP